MSRQRVQCITTEWTYGKAKTSTNTKKTFENFIGKSEPHALKSAQQLPVYHVTLMILPYRFYFPFGWVHFWFLLLRWKKPIIWSGDPGLITASNCCSLSPANSYFSRTFRERWQGINHETCFFSHLPKSWTLTMWMLFSYHFPLLFQREKRAWLSWKETEEESEDLRIWIHSPIYSLES